MSEVNLSNKIVHRATTSEVLNSNVHVSPYLKFYDVKGAMKEILKEVESIDDSFVRIPLEENIKIILGDKLT